MAEAAHFKPQEHDGQGGGPAGKGNSPVEDGSDSVERKLSCHSSPGLLQTRESILVENSPTW